MGTRANFFIGDPRDLETRKWLGCIAWDGYPNGEVGALLKDVSTPEEFQIALARLVEIRTEDSRNDFCDPKAHGFPFPWTDDLFLTDWTYALVNGQIIATAYHHGFRPLTDLLNEEFREQYYEETQEDELPRDVPAPTKTWDRSGHDSIMIVTAG